MRHKSKFPVKIQMDGKLYTVIALTRPKTGEIEAVAYTQTPFFGKRRVESPSIRIRLAQRVVQEIKGD
ncbi:hypothetical protein [Sulfoacidibacillus thermotolerans]|uniref:Uncharacterized protein n=1 Tax=Sulfoacidibacillus thermotolerans TaxID=1765684 RepID=A0A2U3D5U5_SULT2|nr:hypothetical protein [Sulfoacidibacillus thermotolerans]PWI56628.1 hypothetical protein BM613_12670 [Sulfoacidibacillus thermotolerans]